MNFINNILIPFILGFTIYTLIDYLIFKYSDQTIFTPNISTNEITFTNDYMNLLTKTTVNDFDIIYKNSRYFILHSTWTITDIVGWLESLKYNDYAVSFHLVQRTSEGVNSRIIKDQIIVNNQSNPMTITTFLMAHLESINCREGYYCVITYTTLRIAQ